MRIAMLGKGGSGKTTVAALFCRYLKSMKLPVLAIDADINQNLGEALGFERAECAGLPKLGEEQLRLKTYFAGSNPLIVPSLMLKTTPPGRGSRLLRLNDTDSVLNELSITRGPLRFLATGSFEDEDLGTHCYHSKTGAVELILNHLIDGPGEYIVVDMTAGIDAFASGLFAKFDLSVVVVEPSVRSADVYIEYRSRAEKFGLKTEVIANKVSERDDLDFIRERCGIEPLGVLSASAFVKSADRGAHAPIENLEPSNQQALSQTLTALNDACRDWKKFYELSVYFHEKNCTDWANALYGRDLKRQIDRKFDLSLFV